MSVPWPSPSGLKESFKGQSLLLLFVGDLTDINTKSLLWFAMHEEEKIINVWYYGEINLIVRAATGLDNINFYSIIRFLP